MRYFLAHSKRDGENQAVLDARLQLARSILGDEHEVVFARDDFLQNADSEGGWNGWCRAISDRTDPDTGTRFYDGILVLGNRVGKATAAIVEHALEVGVQVFVLEDERAGDDGTPIPADGWEVGKVDVINRKDFLNGWALTPV